jgi:3-oxoacyl-[acyl-carrier protein] reductase
MPISLQYRVAVVTGAGQGIGAAIANSLHERGHAVVLLDKDVGRAASVVDDLMSKRSVPAVAMQVDVRDKRSVQQAIIEAKERFGSVNILVNNAARTQAADFLHIDTDEWDDVMAVNLRSIVFTAQAVIPIMKEKRWGRLINLASLAGQRGGPQVQGAHYATSKAGIIGLSRYLAHEYAAFGITSNVISPGPIQTEQTKLAPPDKLAMVMSQVPVGKLGNPQHVGDLAAFIASDEAEFITGATFDINGGLLMR